MKFLPFDIGLLSLTDLSTVRDVQRVRRAKRLGLKYLTGLIARTRDTRLCDPDLFLHRRSEAWKRAHDRDSTLTWEKFLRGFDPQLTDSDCDSRLMEVSLEVQRDGRLVGVWYLYNVRTVSESDTLVEATAYPAPGLPFVDADSWASALKRIMVSFLNRDLQLKDGRAFRLVAWEFPTEPGHRWRGEAWAEKLMADLQGEGLPRDDRPDGTVRRIRRRAL